MLLARAVGLCFRVEQCEPASLLYRTDSPPRGGPREVDGVRGWSCIGCECEPPHRVMKLCFGHAHTVHVSCMWPKWGRLALAWKGLVTVLSYTYTWVVGGVRPCRRLWGGIGAFLQLPSRTQWLGGCLSTWASRCGPFFRDETSRYAAGTAESRLTGIDRHARRGVDLTQLYPLIYRPEIFYF